jgi:DNA-binding NtrC family response regulator
MHIFIGELDGKRGLLASAQRHQAAAQGLLQSSPNLWLQMLIRINMVAVAILRCDLEQALVQAGAALTTSLECGAIWGVRASMGNLADIFATQGDFDKALEHLRAALGRTSSFNDQTAGLHESMARVFLAQGRFEECEALLDQIEQSTQQPDGTGRYVFRHALLTKAEVLARQHRWDESLATLDRVSALARVADDQTLATAASLLRAETLLHLDRPADAWQSIADTVPSLTSHPPDMYALYERVVASVLAGTGDVAAGRRHQDRARVIYQGLHTAPALVELGRSWQDASAGVNATGIPRSGPRPAAHLVQNIAALLRQAGRPELIATSLIGILSEADCAGGALAVMRDARGVEEILASYGAIGNHEGLRVFSLGTSRGRTVEIRVRALTDMESQATLNSIVFLLGTLADLEQAQLDREERLALWPPDEMPEGGDDAVVTGRMQGLMSFARKVARANVTVLITGESGTGKEVLARAIHGFSARAGKPFVPFNCTAVPRDLLESHLFGYRRGAFTGADRDHPGLIRTAKDGTLFLDEIGELGLDLQPKLLRFLEMGEVSPLGDTGPSKVDARIIAATNANIERMVEDGRFREDLYYRLNVIALAIPPLRERRDEIPALVHHFVRKAAAEFDKGRVRVAEETMERLLVFPWPGNVRQLQNELRRMVALAEPDAVLGPAALSASIRRETQPAVRSVSSGEIAVPLHDKLPTTISRIETEMIKAALKANHGRVEAASRALGISRKGLYLKRQRLGV